MLKQAARHANHLMLRICARRASFRMMGGCMRLLLISLFALLNIGPARAQRLQIGDPLQIVSAPSGRILFQDKRGFWEDDSRDWLEVLLREFSEREGLRRPFTIDLFIPSDAIQRR
jgi:hypothetical protein